MYSWKKNGINIIIDDYDNSLYVLLCLYNDICCIHIVGEMIALRWLTKTITANLFYFKKNSTKWIYRMILINGMTLGGEKTGLRFPGVFIRK